VNKWIYTAILSILACSYGLTQNNSQLIGKVADSISHQPIPFVTIAILNQKQTAIKNVVSDSLGYFILTGIPLGSYNLVLSAVGYKRAIVKDLNLNSASHVDIGLQLLSPDTGMLKEVIVQGHRPIISSSLDGFAYNPENDIIAAGSTASDLLRKIPMVTVDQNGSPTIRGSSNIRVYIDDKPSDIYAPTVADALRQLSAEDIVRVEIILYPSAKYDAEGTDGVINIITRKTRFDAMNGNVQLRIGNRQQFLNTDLNVRRGKWIFSPNAGISYNNSKSKSALAREDLSSNEKDLLEQLGETDNNGKVFYGGINSFYVINDLHALSAAYRFRFNRNYADRILKSNYFENDSLLTAFTRITDNTTGNDLNSFNFSYNGKSRNRKRQYSFLVFYFEQGGLDNYDMDQYRKQVNDYRERFRGSQVNNELNLQVDYTNNLKDNITWDAGAKSSFRKYVIVNDFEVYEFPSGPFVYDPGRSNEFDYHRDIHAVYSNLNMRHKSWQLRVGARYEQTIMQTVFKDSILAIPDFKNLVPSILLSKSFGDKHVLKWSYGKRITRPFLNTLNPAINYIDSFNLQSGNPYLQPENTNRYEMSYVFTVKQFFAMASLYYNSTHNGIEQVRIPYDGGVFMNTYRNIGRSDLLGMYFSVNWKWKQKLSATVTSNFRQSWFESESLQQSNQGFQAGTNFSITYNLGKGYSIDGLGNINSPDITLQGKREVWKYYAIVFNKKFKGDRTSLSLRIENIFPPSYQGLTTSWTTPQFSQLQVNSYQNQYLWLSFSWKWGKKEVKAPVIRQETSNE